MPTCEHGILVHAWIKICLRVIKDGPVHSFSGLAMERYMGLIRTQMHDRARPETSFVNHHSLGVALVNVGGAFQEQITQGYSEEELKTVAKYLPTDMLKKLTRPPLSSFRETDQNISHFALRTLFYCNHSFMAGPQILLPIPSLPGSR
jgi:hypothetical protein